LAREDGDGFAGRGGHGSRRRPLAGLRWALAGASFAYLALLTANAEAFGQPPLVATPLTVTGTQLPGLRSDPQLVNLSLSVPLGGDVPIASYIAFRPASSNIFFQRNELGVWVPWDGKIESLINNGYQPANGTLNYAVAPIDLSPYMFPLTVIVGYWTGAELKFGQFDVESLP
jgi:hypothetical protein